MEFFVYSRAAIERIAPHDVPHLIVSITSSIDDIARLPENEHTLGVVRLVFLDVPAHLPAPMTSDDAAEILDAFARHRDRIERVIVHCDAGVSRSPAVAVALARIAGQDDRDLLARYRPNPHVLETMTREAARRILSPPSRG